MLGGLTLMLKFTLANIALVIGWAVVGLYVYSLQIEGTNISLFNLIMVVINGFAMIFLAVLGLLYYITLGKPVYLRFSGCFVQLEFLRFIVWAIFLVINGLFHEMWLGWR